MLAHHRFDPTSFSITTTAGGPAIAYALPGSGEGDAGHVLALDPIAFAQPPWWRDVASSLPMSSSGGARDVWRHGNYSVVVRYDSTGDARLSIRDSTSREWAIGPVSAPATRIFWLDRPRLDEATRRALLRAFDDAAAYGSDTKVASGRGRATRFLAARFRFAGCSFSPSTRPIARFRSCEKSSKTSSASNGVGRKRSSSSI